MAELTDDELAAGREQLAAVLGVPVQTLAALPEIISAGVRSVQLQDVGVAVLALQSVIGRAQAAINDLSHTKDVLSAGTDASVPSVLELLQTVLGEGYTVSVTAVQDQG